MGARVAPPSEWFEGFLTAVRDGKSLRDALATTPRAPAVPYMYRLIKADPALAQRLDEAIAQRGSGKRTRVKKVPAAEWDAILDAIATRVLNNLDQEMVHPSYSSMRYKAQTEPEFAAKLAAAWAKRDATATYQSEYSEDAFDNALEALRRSTLPLDEVILPEDGPSIRTIHFRASKDTAFQARYERAVGNRIVIKLGIVRDEDRNHQNALEANDLYRKARGLFRLSDRQDGEDLYSEAILALLEEREINQKTAAQSLYRKIGAGGVLSMDQPVGEHHVISDFVTADTMLWGA